MLSAINKRFIKAARNNQIDKFKNLLSQGANIHANDDYALRFSAAKGHIEIVKFLILQGANIYADNDKALILSAQNGHDDVWRALSAFIQEEKLLVAASESTSASTWGCGTDSGGNIYTDPGLSSDETASKKQRLSITKTNRSKI